MLQGLIFWGDVVEGVGVGFGAGTKFEDSHSLMPIMHFGYSYLLSDSGSQVIQFYGGGVGGGGVGG